MIFRSYISSVTHLIVLDVYRMIISETLPVCVQSKVAYPGLFNGEGVAELSVRAVAEGHLYNCRGEMGRECARVACTARGKPQAQNL